MNKYISEEFDVRVSIENATDIIGLNAYISYDSAIIEVVDTDGGTAGVQPDVSDLGFIPNATLLVSLENGTQGTLVCGYASVPASPVSGTGDCFTVKFRAIGAGSTDLVFLELNLQDLDGDVPVNSNQDNVTSLVMATVNITVL